MLYQHYLFFSPAKLDPPVVTTIQVNGSLLVLLRAPELPYRTQNGNNTSMENYYDLVYRVFIIDNLLEKVSSSDLMSGSFICLMSILILSHDLSL